MRTKIIRITIIVMALSMLSLSGCSSREELSQLQGRYDELQKSHDELNEKYLKLYTDYENLKAEKEKSTEGSKYYEPSSNVDAPFDEITIMAPTGEVIRYSTEREKFQILEQLQIDHDKTVVQNEDGSMTISGGRPDRDELINRYWELSGWGPYRN